MHAPDSSYRIYRAHTVIAVCAETRIFVTPVPSLECRHKKHPRFGRGRKEKEFVQQRDGTRFEHVEHCIRLPPLKTFECCIPATTLFQEHFVAVAVSEERAAPNATLAVVRPRTILAG